MQSPQDRNKQVSTEFAFRVVGGFIFGTLLAIFGDRISGTIEQPPVVTIMALALIGFMAGLILTPYVTTRPLRYLRGQLFKMSSEQLMAIFLGLLLGLLAGGLFSVPLSFLPSPFREILPLASVVVFSYFSILILYQRQEEFRSLLAGFNFSGSSAAPAPVESPSRLPKTKVILLDTSVIIDGRISDISKTGFIRDTILIPGFILRELQHIADSPDAIRRNRGRRGLEVLTMLQQESIAPVELTDLDPEEARDADGKLVALARQLKCAIMTNDYNLNRVAELQGVNVLNINDLANSVKVAYIPGEELSVRIIQEGRELGQGVGYLDDGTMVVVEDGIQQMHALVSVIVTKVLQTSAGRMIFGRFPTENEMDVRRG
ncbi:MAG: PIN domain-containing protein [Chloroflexota bacterium]